MCHKAWWKLKKERKTICFEGNSSCYGTLTHTWQHMFHWGLSVSALNMIVKNNHDAEENANQCGR